MKTKKRLTCVIASSYELTCSCAGEWDIARIKETKCPECGTTYDAVAVAEEASHAH